MLVKIGFSLDQEYDHGSEYPQKLIKSRVETVIRGIGEGSS